MCTSSLHDVPTKHLTLTPHFLSLRRNYPATTPARPQMTNARRSHSDDSVRQTVAAEKAKAAGRKPGKKGSSHADVIDRLDFTGVGPSASSLLFSTFSSFTDLHPNNIRDRQCSITMAHSMPAPPLGTVIALRRPCIPGRA